ncbi:restriction endonuclease subunit S, partial [Candidatus Sumerlaeota bacterium]|nr:restriction endonuclease subunit S [Candidatus Sumerlaeota bacterium]
SSEEVNNLLIPYPSINEQNEISNYLDRKTNQIENSINKIYREIALLQEYRAALISEVVTGKIDVRNLS